MRVITTGSKTRKLRKSARYSSRWDATAPWPRVHSRRLVGACRHHINVGTTDEWISMITARRPPIYTDALAATTVLVEVLFMRSIHLIRYM